MEMIGIYPACVLKNSQVFSISCGTLTLGLFQWGFGIRLNAYGPANGGLVNDLNTFGGPRSVFTVFTDLDRLFDLSFKYCKSELYESLGDNVSSAAGKLQIMRRFNIKINVKWISITRGRTL